MTDAGSGQTKAVRQVSDKLGVRLFTRPPESFEPLQASDRELLVHGYPSRPDAHLHPELHEHWERTVSRAKSSIQPKFAVTPERRQGLKGIPVSPADVPPVGQITWCGLGGYPYNSTTFVSGQWTVPDVVVPDASKDAFACTTWVGMNALRVGTWQQISLADGHQTRPFFWYDADIAEQVESGLEGPSPVWISNLPVSPGDVMYGVICVYSATSAGIHLLNVTTGAGRSFTVAVAAGSLSEQSGLGGVWWMLEVPNFEGGPSRLPRYGDVYFDNCIAETSDNSLIYASSGPYEFNSYPGGYAAMLDNNGQEISVALVETDRLFKVVYTGP